MLARAKAATSTGILLEELPLPVAFVAGKHPVRPGQPECKFFKQKGICGYNQRCVYNHSPAVYHAHHAAAAASTSATAAEPSSSSSSLPSAAAAPPAVPSSSVPATPAQPAVRPPLPRRPGQQSCLTFMLRGFCPAGASCAYDHPPAGAQQSAVQAVAQPPPPPPKTPLYASSSSPPAVAASSAASSSSAAGPSTRRQPDTQQHLDQQGKQAIGKVFVPPLVGWTADGLPMRLGAANCGFYTHTGTCRFGKDCIQHHPEHMALPIDFVDTGCMTGKLPDERRVPYSRLVSHLSRVWEYTSCSEAQIKTWVAKLLLALGNQGCSMWCPSAAQLAMADDDPAAAGRGTTQGRRFGRYSCSLAEAGTFVSKLWKEQPGAAEAGPMPSMTLRALLSSDPFFQVLPDPYNSTHFHVKLNFNKLKQRISF